MSTESIAVVILCEDRQQECFIRRFLQKRGKSRYVVRSLISPSGRGSGEQWVREQFPTELKAFRAGSNQRNTWLIVATDADKKEVEDRMTDFEEVCKKADVPFRRGDEKVAFIIPKRNIETWFAYLRGEEVNEGEAYRKYSSESDCRDDVNKLHEMCFADQKLREPAPPSLVEACEEYKRLKN